MFSFWTLLPFLTFLHQIQPSCQDFFAGPYETVLKEIKLCKDTGTNQVRIVTSNMKKLGKDMYSFTAKFAYEIPVGDNLDGKMMVSKKVDGKWVKGYLQEEFSGLCRFFHRMTPAQMDLYLKSFGITKCPFPVGEKDLNFTLKLETEMPVAPYGEYMGDFFFYDGVTVVGCWVVYIDFIPIPELTVKKRNRKKPQKN